MAENTDEISKPWAVYGVLSLSIGKVIRDSHGSLDILYIEGQYYAPSLWETKWVRIFDSPIKAMAYCLVKNSELTREEVIEDFLERFPSQAKELEKCLQRPVRLNFRKSTLEELDIPHL